MNPNYNEISAEEIETTYTAATKNPAWGLGDVRFCRQHGRYGLFRFGKNASGGTLAARKLTKMPIITGNAYQANANVYTAETQANKAQLKMDEGNVAAALSANDLRGALVGITLGTGLAQFGLISEHEAATTSQKVTYKLSRSFGTAPVATDDVQVLPLDFCIYATDLSDIVTGLTIVAVADGEYFWRQVWGWAWLDITDAIAIGASTAVVYSFGPSATDGEGFVRDADGDDLDTTPDYTGIALIKADATASTPAIVALDCRWFTR